jgi:hypothetical protein
MRDDPEPPEDLRRALPLLFADSEESKTLRDEVKQEIDARRAAKERILKRFNFHLRAAIARREAEGR